MYVFHQFLSLWFSVGILSKKFAKFRTYIHEHYKFEFSSGQDNSAPSLALNSLLLAPLDGLYLDLSPWVLHIIRYQLSLWILVNGGILLKFTLVPSLPPPHPRLKELVRACAPSNILARIADSGRCVSDISHVPLLIHKVPFLFRITMCPATNIYQIFSCLRFHVDNVLHGTEF